MSAVKAVFGHDVEFDAAGHPIEKGHGALGRVVHQVGEAVAKVTDPEVFADREKEAAEIVRLGREVQMLNDDLTAVLAERDQFAAMVVEQTAQIEKLTEEVNSLAKQIPQPKLPDPADAELVTAAEL